MSHDQGRQGARGQPCINKDKKVKRPRTMADNNKQMMLPKEPNFLGQQNGSLKLNHPTNTRQRATLLRRISFRKVSQQRAEKYLGRRLLPPH